MGKRSNHKSKTQRNSQQQSKYQVGDRRLLMLSVLNVWKKHIDNGQSAEFWRYLQEIENRVKDSGAVGFEIGENSPFSYYIQDFLSVHQEVKDIQAEATRHGKEVVIDTFSVGDEHTATAVRMA